MKNKQGNAAVIVFIVVIVAITAGAIGWMFAKKTEAPAAQVTTAQPTVPATQTQPKVVQPTAAQQASSTAQTDETVNWQTYTNAKYGVEFKYPVGYETVVDDNAGSPSFSVKNPAKDEVRVSGDGPYQYYAFTVSALYGFLGGDPDKFQTPAEWAKNEKKIGITLKEETVNGIPIYTADTTTGGGQKLKENYMFVKKGSVYDFYKITYKIADVGQKILATLKITK